MQVISNLQTFDYIIGKRTYFIGDSCWVERWLAIVSIKPQDVDHEVPMQVISNVWIYRRIDTT
jgi:hypothetical protein